MKKQKFMKLSAFTSDPSLENSFSAPETHNGEISVVFKGKNVSIHGWDGASWTTIYSWNSSDQQFTFENTYQNYYLKSLTGSEEEMSVSFFSISRYQGSTPALAGINRETKLYDIEEVPVYTASDVNKFLTIMSDGSLRWLGLSESYIVEVIGGEEGGGGEQPVSFSEIFFEEKQSFYDTNNPKSGVTIRDFDSDGNTYVRTEFDGTPATVPVADFMTFDGNHPQASKFTMSFWFKSAGGIVSNDFRLAGLRTNYGESGFGFRITNSSTKMEVYNLVGAAQKIDLPSAIGRDWHHVCMVYEAFELDGTTALSAGGFSSGDSIHHKMTCYIDGSSNSVVFEGASTGRILPENSSNLMPFGAIDAINGSGVSGRRFFDSVEMVEGLALTGAQVDTIYADATRQTSAADVA